LVEKYGIDFPVGHSADAGALAEATGAFVNDDPLYVQATGFVLDPDGPSWSASTPVAPSAGFRTTSWALSAT
jgi:hypothetical protein